MTKFFVVLVLTLSASLSYATNISELFKICHQSDKDLDTCLKGAIEVAIKAIGSKGIPDLGVPPVEPIAVKEITFGSGTDAVQLDQTYYDVKLHGFTDNLKITKAHYDAGKKILTFSTFTPILKQQGKYDLKGKILVIPVYGKGDSLVTLKDVTMNHVITFEEEKKQGKTYLKVINYEGEMFLKGANFDFKNLFDGNKLLSDNILKVVNENWSVIIGELREGIVKSYSQIFSSIAQSLVSKVPVNDIFPS
ncbi:unnamed protein product [Diabrotica balteata]|uniref:Uncharacterized protein n=1 Tax=Diabrotica balteata TaxID=107213 RepID=A0A9N9SYH9_DIABA|nr:unnamed protein product [Diabrotica balteata]